ncbi:type VI secretion system membrane subunit TssM [Reyranella sp.]|uniref:type VI secretion system membrane subunit TssM n=1 Tax=Reyranella sp. TaxID=1929291 RepID=UPI00121E1C52|nr:type VI secretion system membrane subunit TssM [Reyranella sp.]TAJ83509.1 MAG: type VI secretion system membrane subunit TssM [Reyranella sp.]
MQAFLRIICSRWVLSFVGVAILALLIWFFGPMFDLLQGWLPRLIVVAVLVLVWGLSNLLIDFYRRRRERKLESGVAEQTAAAVDDGTSEEATALRERMSTALTLLKKARGTRGYLYEQPWYVIIGPPGAGKTTALLNSGLKFPLAAEMGQGPMAGIGGTRLCDWWFTDNAVLIDTAGRYTTQDSNAAVDRAGWDAFLDMLRRTRPRQPLNGVIVGIALGEIANAPADERIAHARAIRLRIKELESRLHIRIPVYALFTKADLIAGFTEFFDDLDREERSQVWGATLPLTKTDQGPVGQFSEELQLLVERLNERLFDRLQAEQSPDRRALIAGFPAQVASLAQPLQAFLVEAFGGSRLDPAPFLRGVYFTSGTQEGTPIDRLTGLMSRAFGLDQRRAASLKPEHGRGYFLGRLVSKVILGEAMLVSEPPAARTRRLAVRVASYALIALATLGATGWLIANRSAGERQIAVMAQALASYESIAKETTFSPVNDSDLPRLLPLLDAARNLEKAAGSGGGILANFDLSQAAKLRAGAETVYRHALGYALLPRLIWRLEAQMRGNFTHPDFLYEATRVYLMLGGQGPLDRALVKEWMTYDWQSAYAGAYNAAVLTGLTSHLDALLARPLPTVPLDDALVAQARTAFSRVPLAARVYSRIRPSAAAQALPSWKPSDALGTAGTRVFMRASGRKLSDGVPGFFTVDGFHKVLLPALATATREVASENWVMGRGAPVALDEPQQRELANAVVALYLADYAKAWDALLQDLEIVPLRSLPQAAQDLYILASPQSPLKELLTAVARQLTLSEPPKPASAVAAAATDAAGKVQSATTAAVTSKSSTLSSLLTGQSGGGAPPLPPGHEIDERYRQLRELVAATGGAPIDQVLKLLNDLQQQLAKLAAAPVGSTAPAGATLGDPSLALRAEAQRQPPPLARWLQAMADSSTALRGGGARQQVIAAYNGAGGPAALCPLAVNGRFPFVPGSSLETPLDDFAKLFAPGGLIDGFFNTQLRPYVDTTGKVWKAQSADGVAAPVSAADIAQFQRAAVIRDLFFAPGSTTIAVRFDMTPLQLDPGASRVSLEFDGTSVTYAHGPSRSTQITWPGPNRIQNVRLVFDPPPPGGTGVLAETGPWAMFRLFGRGTLRQADSPERYTLTFTLGNRAATFEIRAASVLNPFAPGVLQDFRCPSVRD